MQHNNSSTYILGMRIKEVREKKNLTQEYVASQLGVSQRAYSKLETGDTQIKGTVLIEIAKILSVDLVELVPQETSLTYYNYKTHNGHAIVHFVGDVEKIEELYKKVIDSKDREIESLKEMVSILKGLSVKP